MTRDQARTQYRNFWTRVTEYRGVGYVTWAYGWEGLVRGNGRCQTPLEAQAAIDRDLALLTAPRADPR